MRRTPLMALSTLYTARQNLDKNIRSKVIEKFTEDFVLQTTIPRAVAVGEATATLQAVVESNTESAAAFAFRKLVAEIKEVLGDEETRNGSKKRSIRRSRRRVANRSRHSILFSKNTMTSNR